MKIKLSEVQAQRSRLKLQLGQVREQLASTKQSLAGVRGSTALEGQVKEAIDAKINNHHLPLLSNYENALTMIERSYSQLIREFKSITGETSDTAIINTDYLTDLKTKVGGILTDSQSLNSEASRIYSSISDILPLSSPSLSEMNQAKSEMDKLLSKLIADMATFDGLSQDKGIESLLTAQNQELSSLGQAVSLGYHHSGASTFFAQTDFRRSVKEVGQVLNSCVDISQLQSALAKEILNSPYSGHIAEGDLAHFRNLDKKSQEDYAKQVVCTDQNLYVQFKEIMDSDTAKRLGQLFALLPNNLIKNILKSDGFWDILSAVEKSGATGQKAVDLVLKGLVKYEGLSKQVALLSKAGEYLENIAEPVKAATKWTLGKLSNIQHLEEVVNASKNAVGNAKFLGKAIKTIGKVGTVLTYAELAYEGISGGVEEYSKSKDLGKAVYCGTLDAISSVGPLEGATIGASIASVIPVPGISQAVGAGIGFVVGLGIQGIKWAEPKFFDDPVAGTKSIINKAGTGIKDAVGEASKTFNSIGKALGFG